MRISLGKFALALTAGLVSFAAQAAVSLSTGVAPWQVNGNPAVVETLIPGAYVSAPPGSAWVGPTAASAHPSDSSGWPLPGVYTFTLNLGAIAPPTDNLFSLVYASDNGVTWSISNGSFTSGTTSCVAADCFSQYGSAAPGAPYSLSGIFSATSVLTATVTNDPLAGYPNGINPLGLMVSGVTAIPEPGEWAMMLAGLAAVGLMARRRRA